ncbi:MAG: hypothetical protein J4G00_06770 [Actinomycetia bacterium]|nr:hypothetical protein [Actinomycetes bacterium]
MNESQSENAAAPEQGTPMMVAGAMAGGLTAYLFHALGGRGLGADAYAPIGVMWTGAFIIVTVLYLPLEQWVTREVTESRNPLSGGLGLVLVVTGVAVAAAAMSTGWTLPPLTEQVVTHVWQMVLLIVGYGCFWIGKGVLQGRGRYGRVGWMLSAEGLVRLAVLGVVLVTGGGAVGLGWAMVAAPWVVFLFGFWRGRRLDHPSAAGRIFVQHYVVGAAAAHVLVAAAPLAVTYMGGTAAQVSMVFIVFVLFRAPLTLMYSLQGRVLPPLVRMVGRGEGESLRKLGGRLWMGSVGLASLAALLGYLVGPEAVKLLMGSDFVPSSLVTALVAGGTAMAAGVQLLAQILVAGSRTGRLATAWVSGLAAAGLVTWLSPSGPVVAVATGFCAGEAVALLVVGRMVLSRSTLGPSGITVPSGDDRNAGRG